MNLGGLPAEKHRQNQIQDRHDPLRLHSRHDQYDQRYLYISLRIVGQKYRIKYDINDSAIFSTPVIDDPKGSAGDLLMLSHPNERRL